MIPIHRGTALLLSAIFGLGAACSSSEGEGAIVVTVYGEEFIEAGISADAFDDGWAVEFERFSVQVSDVTVGGVSIDADGAKKDLTKASEGEGQELGSAPAPAGELRDSGYTLERVTVEGRAKKGDSEKTFRWDFTDSVQYAECEPVTAVTVGKTSTFQITVHADHLFYDSLVSENPQMLFQPLADADVDDDGEITQEELSDTDIGAYDPGSAGGVEDLWTWLVRLSENVGHADGEGHCHAHPLP